MWLHELSSFRYKRPPIATNVGSDNVLVDFAATC